ncbi:MAG TPA: LysM peptidoglycan-binding domain-containing protein, partial [Mycobacteriales bacterium]|nr:LysM peptidoglycan-binding domain-containing protein [Mycobacteriales bacterium]
EAPVTPPVEPPQETPAAPRPEPVRPPVRRGPRPCPTSVPRPVAEPGLRLTARGRRLVRLLGTVCVLGMLAIGAWALTAHVTAPVVPDSAPSVVVVHAGDSLWTIAHDIAPQSDPRQVVAALEQRNHLDSPVVHVGQTLQIPK